MNTELNEAAEKYADEIRGILWKNVDCSDEPDQSWIPSDNIEKIIKQIVGIKSQWQAEQKQMPTDLQNILDEYEKFRTESTHLAVGQYVDRFLAKNKHLQKGFKSALQYAKPSAGAWVKASERLPEDARYYNCNFQSMPVAYWIDKKNQLIADKDGLRLDKSIWCDILWLDESALQHSDGWIDVSSKPPKAKPILLYNGHWIGVGFYKKNYKLKIDNEPKWSDETGEYITPEPTYWQPLPSPPINK